MELRPPVISASATQATSPVRLDNSITDPCGWLTDDPPPIRVYANGQVLRNSRGCFLNYVCTPRSRLEVGS